MTNVITTTTEPIAETAKRDPFQVGPVNLKWVAIVIVLGVAVHLLLPQVGELEKTFSTIRDARWYWLVIGLIPATLTYVMAAVAVMGAVEPDIPLKRTASVQVASSFVNRITPGNVGGLGLNTRYLERQGVAREAAIGAVALNTVAGFVVHALALVLAIVVVGSIGIGAFKLPDGWHLLVIVAVVLAVAGFALWSPLGRKKLWPHLVEAARSLKSVLRRPKKALLLFGGSAGITLGYALSLIACAQAFKIDVSTAHVGAAYVGGDAVASAAPTPGGLGAMEAALSAGLTRFGAASGTAVASVLAFRLLTFWLPVLPGYFMLRWLRRHDAV